MQAQAEGHIIHVTVCGQSFVLSEDEGRSLYRSIGRALSRGVMDCFLEKAFKNAADHRSVDDGDDRSKHK